MHSKSDEPLSLVTNFHFYVASTCDSKKLMII